MSTWTRAKFTRACGNCGDAIKVGEPLLELRLVFTTKVRCQLCDGPAPPDLPIDTPPVDAPVVKTSSSGMHPIQSIARMLPLDWKARSAGEREPGEEG